MVTVKTIGKDSLGLGSKHLGLFKLKIVSFKEILHFLSSEILRFSFLESNKYL
jgi:hypothetical protein